MRSLCFRSCFFKKNPVSRHGCLPDIFPPSQSKNEINLRQSTPNTATHIENEHFMEFLLFICRTVDADNRFIGEEQEYGSQ